MTGVLAAASETFRTAVRLTSPPAVESRGDDNLKSVPFASVPFFAANGLHSDKSARQVNLNLFNEPVLVRSWP